MEKLEKMKGQDGWNDCICLQMFPPGARFPPQFAGFPPPGPPFFHPDAR